MVIIKKNMVKPAIKKNGKPIVKPPPAVQPSTSGPKVVVSSHVSGIYKGKNNGSSGPTVM